MKPILEDLKYQFRTGNKITQLVVINAALFILINLVRIILLVSMGSIEGAVQFESVLNWILLPLNTSHFLLKPWTIVSYMFLHYDLFHVFWNMVTLFFFGRIIHEYLGNKRVLPIYILGGLAGGLTAIVGAQLFHIDGRLIGASAGVMAMVIAATTLLPTYRVMLFIIGEVKLIYVTAFFILIDVLGISYFENIGGHFAHLGGALLGFVFIKQLQKGNDWSKWPNALFNFIAKPFNRQTNLKVVYSNPNPQALSKDQKQKRIDEILDKISRSGYDSLTKEEKDELFKMSK